jgi:hypothetical protein
MGAGPSFSQKIQRLGVRMILTIISFILAVAIATYSQLFMLQIELVPLAVFMTFVGTAFLIIQPLLQILILSPLQKTEQNLVPYLIENYHKDTRLKLTGTLLYLFVFISYLFAISLISFHIPNSIWIFALWIFGLGISMDLLREQISQMVSSLNPFKAVEKIEQHAKMAIKAGDQTRLLNNIDALSEVAMHSLERGKLTLATQALDTYPAIMKPFFTAATSISHGLAANEKDLSGYTLFYLIQRLNLIFDSAQKCNYEIICQHIITILGKIITSAAHCDLSLVTYPTQILGVFVQKAQHSNMNAVAITANSTLVEVSKTIISGVDLSYFELEEPFKAIIIVLDGIAKQRFKKDKTSSIRMLMQPLLQIREQFKSEKITSHRDGAKVVANVDQIIEEFVALEGVMRGVTG